jgi:uncharacterized membrane protein YjjP (DUF1212 family)
MGPMERIEVFIEKLGRALHRYGSPAHRLEEAMGLVARRLGVEGQFFALPTSIFASLGRVGERRTVMVRVEPGDVDLEKLELLDRLLGDLVRGDLDLEGAAEGVDAVTERPARYGAVATTAAFAAVSGGAAQFFGGGWPEIVAAGVVGLAIGLLAQGVARFPSAGRLFELTAALLSAAIAALAATYPLHGLGPAAPFLVTLAGLIVLVPGLTLTVAMTELASRHLVAGASRLAGAGLVFLMLAFGVGLSQRLATLVAGAPVTIEPHPLPAWAEAPALVVVAAGLTVLFRAAPKRYGWILLAGVVGLVGSRLGVASLGPELGALTGAVLVGLAGNAYSRFLDRPAVSLQMPGLILLVPGSVGFRSLASLLDQDAVAGVQTAFSMTLVAIALVTGLLVANMVLPPRRPL